MGKRTRRRAATFQRLNGVAARLAAHPSLLPPRMFTGIGRSALDIIHVQAFHIA